MGLVWLFYKVKNKKWEVDHVFPIKAFLDYGISDLKIINCLDNLQPLSEYDNCSKNAKYDCVEFEKWLVSKKVLFKGKVWVYIQEIAEWNWRWSVSNIFIFIPILFVPLRFFLRGTNAKNQHPWWLRDGRGICPPSHTD